MRRTNPTYYAVCTIYVYRQLDLSQDFDDEIEYDVEIEGTVSDIVPARTSGPIEACHPAEGGEVEILRVTLTPTSPDHEHLPVLKLTGVEFRDQFTAQQVEQVEEALFLEAADYGYADAREDYA